MTKSPDYREDQLDPGKLREIIFNHFNDNELRSLYLDLGINYDAQGGSGTNAKSRELVALMMRRKELPTLANKVLKARPKLTWDLIIHEEESKTDNGFQENSIWQTTNSDRLYINRFQEIQLFEEVLSGYQTKRIILIEAEGGLGKTSLLSEFAHRVQNYENVACVTLDMKGRTTGLGDLFSWLCDILGKDNFPKLTTAVAQFTSTKSTPHFPLSRIQIHKALDADNLNTYYLRLGELTEALSSDLMTIHHDHVVFLIDTFEQADNFVTDWFKDFFLSKISNNPKLIAVIGGKVTPEIMFDWTITCQKFKLNELAYKDWLEYAKCLGVPLAEDTIWAFHRRFNGHPAEMVKTLNMFNQRDS